MFLTYEFNWSTSYDTIQRDDLDPIVPSHLKADSLSISKNGIIYDGIQHGKELIL